MKGTVLNILCAGFVRKPRKEGPGANDYNWPFRYLYQNAFKDHIQRFMDELEHKVRLLVYKPSTG
jgi:hypothetical protein